MAKAGPSIVQLRIGPMMNFAYLIGDQSTRSCAVVDPGWDAQAIIEAAHDSGWKIDAILLTHTHFDHVGALRELALETGACIYVHRDEMNEIAGQLKRHATEDGSILKIGQTGIECIHTPGHTPGSQCFIVNGSILTGDTLFVDGCGRVDLPGSDPEQMLSSLHRLARLDPSTVVYPGHDYGAKPVATIAELLVTNPYLKASSEDMLL